MQYAGRFISLIVAIFVFTLLMGCVSESQPTPEYSEAVLAIGDPERGAELYRTGGASGIPCASCHATDDTDLVGPGLGGISATANERVPELSAEDYLVESIVNPGAYVVDGFSDSMNKNYAVTLSEQDINDIVAYMLTLE